VASHDEGARRLGEVALVDGEGRIGRLGTVFYDTRIDENAASHIALGQRYEIGVGDPHDLACVNQSAIHVDFMVGGADVDVTGRLSDGEEIPLLRRGHWQF
jgi:aminopeptidase